MKIALGFLWSGFARFVRDHSRRFLPPRFSDLATTGRFAWGSTFRNSWSPQLMKGMARGETRSAPKRHLSDVDETIVRVRCEIQIRITRYAHRCIPHLASRITHPSSLEQHAVHQKPDTPLDITGSMISPIRGKTPARYCSARLRAFVRVLRKLGTVSGALLQGGADRFARPRQSPVDSILPRAARCKAMWAKSWRCWTSWE